jgi:hypothetical protein
MKKSLVLFTVAELAASVAGEVDLTTSFVPVGSYAKHKALWANATILDTIYIRNGTLVGNARGHLIATIDKMNAKLLAERGTTELDIIQPQEDFHLGIGSFSIDINALDILAVAGVVAGAACWFSAGCSGAVAAKFASIASASASAGTEGVALRATTTLGSDTRFRRDTEYEVFGCEYEDADHNYCSNGDVMQQIINGVGANDDPTTTDGQAVSGSVWSIVVSMLRSAVQTPTDPFMT